MDVCNSSLFGERTLYMTALVEPEDPRISLFYWLGPIQRLGGGFQPKWRLFNVIVIELS